jgi:hypothetical protein
MPASSTTISASAAPSKREASTPTRPQSVSNKQIKMLDAHAKAEPALEDLMQDITSSTASAQQKG